MTANAETPIVSWRQIMLLPEEVGFSSSVDDQPDWSHGVFVGVRA
jgi:hypothetical protein